MESAGVCCKSKRRYDLCIPPSTPLFGIDIEANKLMADSGQSLHAAQKEPFLRIYMFEMLHRPLLVPGCK